MEHSRIDEGQDFARSWLESLELMLGEPGVDVLYVFHDPEQALYRDDVVAPFQSTWLPKRR
ncbi:hypothetical protein BH23CHL7_BH23CHL7_15940 [soil metagenome]